MLKFCIAESDKKNTQRNNSLHREVEEIELYFFYFMQQINGNFEILECEVQLLYAVADSMCNNKNFPSHDFCNQHKEELFKMLFGLYTTNWYNHEHAEEINFYEPNDNVCLFLDDKSVQNTIKKKTPYQIERMLLNAVNIAVENNNELFEIFNNMQHS